MNIYINLSVHLKSTTLPILTTPSTTLISFHLRGGAHFELTPIWNNAVVCIELYKLLHSTSVMRDKTIISRTHFFIEILLHIGSCTKSLFIHA